MQSKFCQECSVELSQATFGIPFHEAEEWKAHFKSYEWPMSVDDTQMRSQLNRADPDFNPSTEMIVCIDSVKQDSWLRYISVSGNSISGGQQRSANVVVTNWRVVVLDYTRNRTTSFLYPYLQKATIQNEYSGTQPNFHLDFGTKGYLSLTRSPMPAMESKPRGALSRMLAPAHHNAMMDILYLREVDHVKANYGKQAAENKLYLGWFNRVIDARQKF